MLPLNHSPDSSTGLNQVLALVKRSDSVSVKSEGTRVLVNAVKSLWSNDASAGPGPEPIASAPTSDSTSKEVIVQKQRKRAAAMRTVLTPECALALSSLVGRSGKYPLLVNEGVVALTLLSTQKEGGKLLIS